MKFFQISVGDKESRRYAVTEDVYAGFLSTFEDRNPVHVNAEAAKALGFEGPLMHGAILNGFLSHFIGMVFPGPSALLLGADLRYHRPIYLGNEILLEAEVAQIVTSQRVIILHLSFTAHKHSVARGRVQVRVDDA